MLEPITYTVSELTQYVKELLENDGVLSSVLVTGEISNFTHHSSGHMYFTVKDSNSRLKCVMFRFRSQHLRFTPRGGMKVLLQGRLSVYEKSGEYQLYVENMHPDGVGALHLAYTQLKDKLEAEGLFAAELKKQPPMMPRRIGVVTSPTGAALRDIITTIHARLPSAHIVIAPAIVQGGQAAASIAQAIENLNLLEDVDVVIVGRGGGSIEELWAFNEEVVARAIAQSVVPVVSAVGHETDYTIADFVADVRVPTPTAAGQFVVPARDDLYQQLERLDVRMDRGLSSCISERADLLAGFMGRLDKASPQRQIEQRIQEVDNLSNLLHYFMENSYQKAASAYEGVYNQLQALSPLKVIHRGYTVTRLVLGEKLVTQAADLSPNEQIEVLFQDGKVVAMIQDRVIGEWYNEPS